MFTLSVKRKIGDNILTITPVENDRTCYKTFEETKERLRALMIAGEFVTVNHCVAKSLHNEFKTVDAILDGARHYVHLNKNGNQIFTKTYSMCINLIDDPTNNLVVAMSEEFSIVELDITTD